MVISLLHAFMLCLLCLLLGSKLSLCEAYEHILVLFVASAAVRLAAFIMTIVTDAVDTAWRYSFDGIQSIVI